MLPLKYGSERVSPGSGATLGDPDNAGARARNRWVDRVRGSADTWAGLMEKEETLDDGSRLREVEITIVVVPGRLRATLTKLLASARVCTGLVSAVLIAAIAAVAIIAVSSSTGAASLRHESHALASQFGLPLPCARRTVVSSDGAYARIDLDHGAPCGTFGNHVTLILHRRHGVWVRDFEASSWTCPISQLAQPVALELQLCRASRVATSTGGALSKIPLDH